MLHILKNKITFYLLVKANYSGCSTVNECCSFASFNIKFFHTPSVFCPFVSVFSLSMIPLLVFVDMATISQHTRGWVQPVYSQNTFGGGVNSPSLTNRRPSMFLMACNLSWSTREHLWCLSWYLGANTPNIWGERGSNPPCKKMKSANPDLDQSGI